MSRDFPGLPGVKVLQRDQFPSLVRELRSHMPWRVNKKDWA